MTPPLAPSLPAQLACAEKELAQRQSAYPRLVQTGYLSHQEAQHELACMRAICQSLRGLLTHKHRRGQAELFPERND